MIISIILPTQEPDLTSQRDQASKNFEDLRLKYNELVIEHNKHLDALEEIRLALNTAAGSKRPQVYINAIETIYKVIVKFYFP